MSEDPPENSVPGSYPCQICREVFEFKSRLTAHMRTHSDRKPFKVRNALLLPATKLGQGNIFRSVCQEFCPQGGGVHGSGGGEACVAGGMRGRGACVAGGYV